MFCGRTAGGSGRKSFCLLCKKELVILPHKADSNGNFPNLPFVYRLTFICSFTIIKIFPECCELLHILF